MLNDVLRYWRTLTVDYEAKRWERLEREWGLRYLKLRISRKIAFAGTLASIFLCERPAAEYFTDQFAKPPLARLAQLYDHLDDEGRESLREVFEIADFLVDRLGNRDFRDRAKAVSTRQELSQDEELRSLREDARRLQTALEVIFFGSDRLGGRARRYLSF